VRHFAGNKHWSNLQFAGYFDVAGEAAVEGSACTRAHLSLSLLLTTLATSSEYNLQSESRNMHAMNINVTYVSFLITGNNI